MAQLWFAFRQANKTIESFMPNIGAIGSRCTKHLPVLNENIVFTGFAFKPVGVATSGCQDICDWPLSEPEPWMRCRNTAHHAGSKSFGFASSPRSRLQVLQLLQFHPNLAFLDVMFCATLPIWWILVNEETVFKLNLIDGSISFCSILRTQSDYI